jgi:hypothetical protein
LERLVRLDKLFGDKANAQLPTSVTSKGDVA